MDSGERGRASKARPNGNDHTKSERVAHLLRLLEKLAKDTDPAGGTSTARAKDQRAFIAIGLAASLAHEVAGWAISHQVGLALKGLEFVPAGHPETRSTPEYAKARRQVDSHDHEDAGVEAINWVPFVQRQVLINILSALDGFLPSDLCASVVRALRGLNHGDQPPIFSARTASAKRGFRERELMLKAIGFIAYKCGQGLKKNIAKADVLNAYGVTGQKAYEDWKKSSRQTFGALAVERIIKHGEIAGSRKRSRKAKLVVLDKFDELLEQEFGEDAFAEAAEEFRQLRAVANRKRERMRKTLFAHPNEDDLKDATSPIKVL